MMNASDPWTSALRTGDFQSAWAVCDRLLAERVASREDCSDLPRYEQFIWRGEPLANRRVLVRCYHGMGDTIQFIRFAAPLRKIAREVTVWVQPPLLPLIATAPGVDRVSALHDGKPEFLYDVDIELMEVPYALRAELDSLAAHVPYLFPRMRSRLPQTDGEALKVGLAWRTGSGAAEGSLPLSELCRLQEVAGVEFYSLQYPAVAEELQALNAIDLACKELELLASRMHKLDLVITSDTDIAHLAGALGLPVWTALPFQSDWRWMDAREDSPWYPTMRLFRQPRTGDWKSVMDEVMESLSRHTLSARPLHSDRGATHARLASR
jgi:hypothetical protein